MNRAELKRWLQSPSITGYQAILWGMIAIAVPTFFRASVDDLVTGVAVTPFVPSVLLATIFLEWKYAAGITLGAATVADAFFIGPPLRFLEGPTDLIALGLFLFASVLIIGFVCSQGPIAESAQGERNPWRKGKIVFSLEKGQAWAGWHGERARVRLGPNEEVAEMMEDFLAQVELGKYLSGKARQADR